MAPLSKLLSKMVIIIMFSLLLLVEPYDYVVDPSCPSTCGNLTIPYPFGTREGCYHDDMFLITCNSTTNTPFIRNSTTLDVVNISPEGQLTIHTPVTYACYNPDGTVSNTNADSDGWSYLTLKAFPFNTSSNKFTAVGCDTLAYLNFPWENYTTGCMTSCPSQYNVQNAMHDGDCSGLGCCESSLLNNSLIYEINVSSLANRTAVYESNQCSYAFVGENYTFDTSDLQNLRGVTKVRTVLDWAIGNKTCAEAKLTSSYACGGNTSCQESGNGPGYRCRCRDGFEGNPYLQNGCVDVDECQIPKKCPENSKCTNVPGSFNCKCIKGYHHETSADGESICVTNLGKVTIPRKLIILGIVLAVIAFAIVALIILAFLLREREQRRRRMYFTQNGGEILKQQFKRNDGCMNAVKIFYIEDLEVATEKFDENRIIGRGGFGTVYRGDLPDGKTVAIKKSKVLDRGHQQKQQRRASTVNKREVDERKFQIDQFINEVLVLSQINHRNVVKFFGCCLDTPVPLLVYEYITNNTLSYHLHNEDKRHPPLPWETRLKIAYEVAGVLDYLHSNHSPRIIHGDVKTANILLDGNYTVKVSDFGASMLGPLDETQLPAFVMGTKGYLDPEYLLTTQLTEKSDVYSFGVVLVELLTGQQAINFQEREPGRKSLVLCFLSSIKENRLDKILDRRIINHENIEQLMKVGEIAMLCLRMKGDERPSMKEVAMKLEGLRTDITHMCAIGDTKNEERENLLYGLCDTISTTAASGCNSMTSYVEMVPFEDGR